LVEIITLSLASGLLNRSSMDLTGLHDYVLFFPCSLEDEGSIAGF
jgi:predicted AAA+ superfamily ATPase